jgi:hypothetical protein
MFANDQDELPHEVVVAETSSSCPANAFLSNIPLPLELTFYSGDSQHYAILVSDEAKLITNHHEKPTKLRLQLWDFVTQIRLLDFPMGQYTLQVNGVNVATASMNDEIMMFDFKEKRSRMLETFIAVVVAPQEPQIVDRENYLNFNRIDSTILHLPKNVHLKTHHQIEIVGYFKSSIDQTWKQGSRVIDLYPESTYKLVMAHPTDSLTIETDNLKGQILVRINGQNAGLYEMALQSPSSPSSYCGRIWCKIKFCDPMQISQTSENAHLNSEINANTLNFTMIHSCELIAFNCQIKSITQHYYQIRDSQLRLSKYVICQPQYYLSNFR